MIYTMLTRNINSITRYIKGDLLCRKLNLSARKCYGVENVGYEQGQSPEPRVREYFYYIDHQGMLFLDDARMKNFTSCFKEKKFLQFFFSRLRFNETNRYSEFPFLSPCGRERNFVRCDDLPFVFTHFTENSENESAPHLAYGNADSTMTLPFQPSELYMQPQSGRLYHPAPTRVGGVGLVRSQLAIQLSSLFVFEKGEEQPPTHLQWEGEMVELSQNLLSVLSELGKVREFSMGLKEEGS